MRRVASGRKLIIVTDGDSKDKFTGRFQRPPYLAVTAGIDPTLSRNDDDDRLSVHASTRPADADFRRFAEHADLSLSSRTRINE